MIQQQLVTRVVTGAGDSSQAERREAFDDAVNARPLKSFLHKVALSPTSITDQDIAAVKDAGHTEDQIFELTVCAAIGQATRQYENGLRALSEALSPLKGSGDEAQDTE